MIIVKLSDATRGQTVEYADPWEAQVVYEYVNERQPGGRRFSKRPSVRTMRVNGIDYRLAPDAWRVEMWVEKDGE